MFVWRSRNFLRQLNTMNFFSETSPNSKESHTNLTVEQIVQHRLLILSVEILHV